MSERLGSTEAIIGRVVERSVAQAVFGGRRNFLKLVGASPAAAALASVLGGQHD